MIPASSSRMPVERNRCANKPADRAPSLLPAAAALSLASGRELESLQLQKVWKQHSPGCLWLLPLWRAPLDRGKNSEAQVPAARTQFRHIGRLGGRLIRATLDSA